MLSYLNEMKLLQQNKMNKILIKKCENKTKNIDVNFEFMRYGRTIKKNDNMIKQLRIYSNQKEKGSKAKIMKN